MANARSARVGRVRIAGATRRALTVTACRARHHSTMTYPHRAREGCGGPVPRGRPRGRCHDLGQHGMPGRFVIIAALLFLGTGVAAHPPEAEFADWFRSLKEPGTEGMAGSGVSCCSPASDCQMTDYETDAEGRYWIIAEGEPIQVPPDKILQRADNPTGRGVACLAITTDIRSCAALSEHPKGKRRFD